jgi:hypothetical protein
MSIWMEEAREPAQAEWRDRPGHARLVPVSHVAFSNRVSGASIRTGNEQENIVSY